MQPPAGSLFDRNFCVFHQLGEALGVILDLGRHLGRRAAWNVVAVFEVANWKPSWALRCSIDRRAG
jgi:hypothetical protein